MQKIIILYTSNLCQRVDDLCSIREWLLAGYEMEYWDISNITYQEQLAPIKIEGLKERVFKIKKDFYSAVRKNANSVFLMWFGFGSVTAFVFRSLTKNNAKFGIICNGLLPSISPQRRDYTLKKLINDFKEIFYASLQRTLLFAPASVSFITASAGKPKYKVGSLTYNAKCNSGDYEAMLKSKKTECIWEGLFFVFRSIYTISQ